MEREIDVRKRNLQFDLNKSWCSDNEDSVHDIEEVVEEELDNNQIEASFGMNIQLLPENEEIQDTVEGDTNDRFNMDLNQSVSSDSENYVHETEEVVVEETNDNEVEETPERDPNDEETEAFTGGIHGQRMFLNNEQRKTLSQLLLQHVKNGKLKKGTREMVASLYSVSKSVVDGIWRQTKESGDASHRKTKNCGRKRIELDPAKFCDVPFSKRTSYRSLAFALNINRTSLCRLTKEGSIRHHSNPIKPSLREENKVARLKFCLSMLQSESIQHDPIFMSMHDIVHIDEKWFYLTKKTVKYYMLPHENDPIRSCHSKNFIQKVMFLTAIARPRFDAQGNELFSGKIGIFPFVTKEAAKRRSRNRAAGTLETKSIHSVTKEVSRKFLIEKVVPAIKAKWPTDTAHGPIYIQQDNARSHIDKNDVEFCQVAKEDGFDIRLMCQPANSPDMNVLDLGFFNAIQSLQHKEAPKTIDDLIFAVENAFDTFSSTDSNKIFLTLQTCMIEVMKEKGSINYKTPHIKKDVLQRQGQLPTQMRCERSLVEEVIRYLRGDDNSDMFEEAMLQ